MDKIKVQVYVDHGYYEYEVSSADQGLQHAQVIMKSGVYRHAIDGGVELHRVVKVKVVGKGLNSQYNDTFKRT